MACLAMHQVQLSGAMGSTYNLPLANSAMTTVLPPPGIRMPPSPIKSSTLRLVPLASSFAAANAVAQPAARPRSAMKKGGRSNGAQKSVKFAAFVEVDYTYPAEDYDRSIVPAANLNFRDFAELLQVRAAVRRQTEEVMREASMGRVAKGNVLAVQARGIFSF